MATDNGGIDKIINNVELLTSVNWNEIISNADKTKPLVICTFSIYEYETFCSSLQGFTDVLIVIGFSRGALYYKQKLEEQFPNYKIFVCNNTHAKILLCNGDEVYLSSQNIGSSDWFQTTVHFKDTTAYNLYLETLISYVSEGVTGNVSIKNESPIDDISAVFKKDPYVPYVPDVYNMVLPEAQCKLEYMVNWSPKFTGHKGNHIYISTFSIPKAKYAIDILKRVINNGCDVTLIVNSQFKDKAEAIQAELPDIRTIFLPSIHAKFVLFEPQTVWLSSQNFGTSEWFENTCRIKSMDAYSFYYQRLKEYLLKNKINL